MVAFDPGEGRSAELVSCLGRSQNDPLRLAIFSSEDGSLDWQSEGLAAPLDICVGVVAGAFAEGQHALVAAVLTSSINAFDAETHAPAWTLPISADGASVLTGGQNGRELVVFQGSLLRFFDAATQMPLRQFELAAPVTAVREPGNDIHRLLVAAGDRLLIIDGVDGSVLATSDLMGFGLGARNQLAVLDLGGGAYLIGAGSDVGVFRYVARMTDALFANGFE